MLRRPGRSAPSTTSLNLTEEEAADIALYINFDMVGSPNFARFIYDGNGSAFPDVGGGPEGSGAIERVFQRYFEAKGLATSPTPFDGRSDYDAFINIAGIPAGGLFTGAEGIKTEQQADVYGGTAGEAYDPCYHQLCDDIDNVSKRALGQMSDAIAHSGVHVWDEHQVGERSQLGTITSIPLN